MKRFVSLILSVCFLFSINLPNLDALIENFDNALSHPDAEDLERLKQAVK